MAAGSRPIKPRESVGAPLEPPAGEPIRDRYADAVDRGYIAEQLSQIQHTLGGLREAVDGLKTSSRTHGEKLERINKIIFAAGVVLIIVLSVGGFILNKIWDALIAALVTAGHLPH
jgi:hypothetical protein